MNKCLGPIAASLLAADIVAAQSADELTTQMQTCALKAQPERANCLEDVARRIRVGAGAQPTVLPRPETPLRSNWVVGETKSPIDYGLQMSATVLSTPGSGAEWALTIHCWAGRTDLSLTAVSANEAPPISGVARNVEVTQRLGDGRSQQTTWSTNGKRRGLTFRGDVVAFLRSLPPTGRLTLRIVDRTTSAPETAFELEGLGAVREKMGKGCKWPNLARH